MAKARSDLPEENYEHFEDDLSSDTDFSIYPFRPSLITMGPVIEIHLNPPVFDGLPTYVPHVFHVRFFLYFCCILGKPIFMGVSENRVPPKLQF